jgi:hypothetical protein
MGRKNYYFEIIRIFLGAADEKTAAQKNEKK